MKNLNIWIGLSLTGIVTGFLFLFLDLDQSQPNIDIWYGNRQYFGHLGNPQRFVNILGTVHHSDEADAFELSYSLNRNAYLPINVGKDLHRLARHGDFNIELDIDRLLSGTNNIRIVAQFEHDEKVSSEVVVIYRKNTTWPLPYTVDFTSDTDIQNAVQVIDGKWRIVNDGLRIQEPYYDRIIGIGDLKWQDYEAVIKLKLNDFESPYEGAPSYGISHFAFAPHWRGHHNDNNQPRRKWYPLGSTFEFFTGGGLRNRLFRRWNWRILADLEHKQTSSTPYALILKAWYFVKVNTTKLAKGSSIYKIKFWEAGTTEPSSWEMEYRDTYNDFTSGGLLIVAHHTDITIANITARPL